MYDVLLHCPGHNSQPYMHDANYYSICKGPQAIDDAAHDLSTVFAKYQARLPVLDFGDVQGRASHHVSRAPEDELAFLGTAGV